MKASYEVLENLLVGPDDSNLRPSVPNLSGGTQLSFCPLRVAADGDTAERQASPAA